MSAESGNTVRVLHINRNYLTSALHQIMMNHLVEPTFEHTVFAPTDDLKKCVIEKNPNVIAEACFTNTDRYFFHKKQKKIQSALERNIDVSQYDVIHAYTLFTDGNCAMKLAKKYNIPYVVAVRNTDVNDFFKKLPFLRHLGIKIMLGASKIFFLSPAYQEQVFDKYVPCKYREVLEKKTVIIPNGVDDFWIENSITNNEIQISKSFENKELNLIFAGRVDKNKNIPLIVDAINLLRDKGWKPILTVVGKIEDQSEYKKFDCLPFVNYLSPVNKEKLAEYYRNNDLFVMPSHTESFGLVYVEALSQGLPVIYTRGQGFDKQFPEGYVGWSVSDTNADELADKIIECTEKITELRKNVANAAVQFNWTEICKRYLQIYDEILA